MSNAIPNLILNAIAHDIRHGIAHGIANAMSILRQLYFPPSPLFPCSLCPLVIPVNFGMHAQLGGAAACMPLRGFVRGGC